MVSIGVGLLLAFVGWVCIQNVQHLYEQTQYASELAGHKHPDVTIPGGYPPGVCLMVLGFLLVADAFRKRRLR